MNNSSNSGGGEGGEQQQLSAAAGNNGGGGVSSPPPSNASPSSSMAVVVVVRATHEYCPVNNDELHIRVGDLITVTNMEEGGWWEGTSSATGTVGWFPSNYVVLVEEGTQQQQQLNHQQQQQQNVVVSTRDNVSGGGNITKHEEYRNEIVAEMVESEAAFITEMESFLERGVKRMIGMVGGNSLGGSPQDPQVLQTLSTCFTMLIAAHKKHVLGELAPLSSGNQTTSSPQTQQITTTSSGSPSSQQQPPRVVGSVRVGRVFLTAAPHLESAHTRYCALHPRVVQFVERNQEVLASSFAGEARDNSGVLKIITSLSAPFRRVERYARVLHEVERHVEEYHWDRGDLQRGVLYYRDLAKTLTDLRKQKEMELEVLTPGAIKDYEGTDITSLGDIILMKLVFVGRDRQPRYFVLFPNTIVILAYDNTDNTLTYKGRVLVSGVTVNPITDGQVLLVQTHQNHNNNQLLDEDNNGNNNNNNGLITNAFEISGPTLHPILVQCPTPKDKVTWLHHLNELLRVTRCFSSSSSGMMMMNNNGSGVVGNVNAATTQPHHQQQQVHHRQHRHDTSRRRRRRQGDDAMKSKKREVVVVEASYPFVRLVEHFRRLYELGVLVTLSNQFLNNNNNDTSCCGNNNHGQESFEGEGEEECFVVRKRVLRFPPAAVVETVPAAAVPVAAGENGSAGYWRGRRRQRGEFISGNQDDDDYDSDELLLLLPPTGNDVAAVRKFKCLSNIHDHNDEDHDNGGGGGGESELFTCRRSFEVDSRHHSNTPTTRGCTSLPKELSYCYHHHHHQHRSQSSSSSSSYHTAYHDDDNNVERVVGYRKSKRVLVRQDAFDYSSDRDSVDSGLGDNNFSGSGGSTAAAAAEGNSGGGGGENEHVGGDVVARAGGGGEDYDDDDELLEEEEEELQQQQQPSVFYNEVFVNVGGGGGSGDDATSREQQQQQQRSSPVTTTTYTNSLYAHWCLKIESDVWNA